MAGKDEDNKKGPAPTGLPLKEKLPVALQKIVDKADKEDNLYDELYDGTAPQSTETNLRYAAYATRVRTALLSAQRYVAYTSDIGESFRPVAHPNWVRAAYGVSWAYLTGDVAHETYKAYCSNQRIKHPELPREASSARMNDAKTPLDAAAANAGVTLQPGKVAAIDHWATVGLQRAIFQGTASMALPAFTIHSIVRYSGQALKSSKNVKLRTYGPIGLGLAAVPALPYIFDHPVEWVVEKGFHTVFELVGGKAAVGNSPATGREQQLEQKKPADKKDKEL